MADNIVPLLPVLSLMAEESRRSLRRSRIFRSVRHDAFNLPDNEFISLFRLNKNLVHYLCEELRPILEPISSRRNVLSVETKVLCALRFYATGSYQKAIANDYVLCIGQKTVSRQIISVTNGINSVLFQKWIKFPTDSTVQLETKQKFLACSGFPGVIGAIDCTHVAVIAPRDSAHMEANYVNRKNFHSINVQLVCDTDMKISHICARFPGSTHDSFIWRSSSLRRAFCEGSALADSQSWLLGDSGYPLEPWLMTPVLQPTTEAEVSYNKSHAKARNIVERCNGVLKSRFRCLLRHRVLHYDPATSGKIINACAVLHNMCMQHNITYEAILCDNGNFDTVATDLQSGTSGKNVQAAIIASRFQ